jgi:hypothetical protein
VIGLVSIGFRIALPRNVSGIVADRSKLISSKLALVANSSCPAPEERTMRETEIQIGNSGLIPEP